MSKNPPPNPLKLASKLLLKPYDLDFEDLDKVFGKLFRHKLDYADLYFQYHRSEAWSLEEGIVKSGSFNIEQGVGVRAITGEKTAFAYSDDISLKALKDAADATRAIADSGRRKAHKIEAAKKSPAALYIPDNPQGSLDDVSKVKLLERLEAMARAEDSRVKEVMASLVGSWEVVMVARSDGHLADGEARLIWHALDNWRLRLDDGIGYRPRAAAFRQRGRQRQTEFKAMSSRA